jgi:hypothetical protein
MIPLKGNLFWPRKAWLNDPEMSTVSPVIDEEQTNLIYVCSQILAQTGMQSVRNTDAGHHPVYIALNKKLDEAACT